MTFRFADLGLPCNDVSSGTVKGRKQLQIETSRWDTLAQAIAHQQSPKVAIVNETFAHYFFGAGPALGRHATTVGVTYENVGVVRDATYRNLRDPVMKVMKTMYIP